MNKPLVYTVTINYNGFQDTIECINSLKKINYSNNRIVVVDNGSTDSSFQKLKDYYQDELIFLKSERNLGYAAGNNVGIKYALENNADYVFIINNDTLFPQLDLLDVLVEEAERNKEIGIIGPKIVQPNGEIDWPCARTDIGFGEEIFVYSFIGRKIFKHNKIFKDHTYNFYQDFTKPAPVYAISGAGFLIKRNAIVEIGLLDENTFLYEEEFIISERLKKTGYKIFTHPEAVMVHKGAQTSKKMKAFSRIEFLKSETYFLTHYKKMPLILRVIIKMIRLIEYVFFIGYKDYQKCFTKFLRELLLKW